ncbi:hypothetical protein BGZ83_000069 [Gryganskiella cystojenkinii]|nr:hypothetical protein BGZ83_000069 [Gryganskiella cystojenkinii]
MLKGVNRPFQKSHDFPSRPLPNTGSARFQSTFAFSSFTAIAMSSTFYLRAASLVGGIGVMSAGYGAHGLSKRVNGDEGKIKSWNTAANIQLIHAVTLLAISQSPALLARTGGRFGAPLILLGTTLFSGSIYGLILDQEKTYARALKLGPLTPLGGVTLICGWLALAL